MMGVIRDTSEPLSEEEQHQYCLSPADIMGAGVSELFYGAQGMGGTFQQQQFYPQQAAGGVQGLQPMPILGSTVGPQPGFMSGAALPYGGSAFHQPQMPQLPPSQAPKFASGPSINGSFF